MANARSRYDALAETLVRRGARYGALFGRACLMLGDAPFLQLASSGLAFRLHGRALAEALALPGARRFDPYDPPNPAAVRPGWVFVPAARHDAWDRLATEALRCAEAARVQPVSWAVPELPAAPAIEDASAPRESIADRAAAALARGFDFDLER